MAVKENEVWLRYVAHWTRGLTQADIGKRAGVSQGTVSRWLTGEKLPTEGAKVAAFARAFHRNVLEAFVAARMISIDEAGAGLSDESRDLLQSIYWELAEVISGGDDDEGVWSAQRSDDEPELTKKRLDRDYSAAMEGWTEAARDSASQLERIHADLALAMVDVRVFLTEYDGNYDEVLEYFQDSLRLGNMGPDEFELLQLALQKLRLDAELKARRTAEGA